jgi:hypothetical protein
MKATNVKNALKVCISAQKPVFLHGSPGVGKSDMVAQVAAELKMTLIDIRAILLDPVDLRGIPTVEDGVTKWAPPSFLPHGKGKYLLFLDELNAAPPLVQAACYQLVLDRKIGEYELPKDAVIIAAGNLDTDKAVTSRMPTPLANRFIHVNVDVDPDEWVKWAIAAGIDPKLIAFIRYRPNMLHNFDPKRGEKAFPTPRSWAFTDSIMKVAGEDLEFDLVSGIVGDGAASEFIGFLRIFRSLPDPDLVIASPETVDVPTDPATKYALTGVLANKATKENFAAIVKFANRLPAEFSVLLVKDAIERDENLVSTRAFIEWSAEHADVLL